MPGSLCLISMASNNISSSPRWRRARRGAVVLGLLSLVLAGPATAQLRLPQLPLPTLPNTPVPAVTENLNRIVIPLTTRASTIADLLRRHPDLIEADPAGQPMRRGELLWLSPSASAVISALAEGYAVLREDNLAELDIRQWVLRPPPGVDTAQAAERLRRLDPDAPVDFNHLYVKSGPPTVAQASTAPPAAALPLAPDAAVQIGLIDGGVDRQHAAFAYARIHTWGCGSQQHPSAHGTAVASLLVGHDGAFSGVQPRATLRAADVYCDQPAGGAAENVAQALAWMVRERVPVINISLVGPPNALLDKATQAVLGRGHLIVAAVGNDGPAAPPLYPAAYRGVVGVSGLTTTRRTLPEAARGPHVMFCALGAQLAVARVGGGYGEARGTSYASPIVAGLLAGALPQPDVQAAAAALARWTGAATDLGEPGRDPVFGFGLIGESLRTPPERMAGRRR
jgi:Subtilase family